MRLAFEAPLDKSLLGVAYGDFAFGIAPMFSNKKYKLAMTRSNQLGKELWLDNGAYEGELFTTEDLYALCSEIQPQVVVAPDVIEDFEGTLKLTSEFIEAWNVDPPSTSRLMGVIQGKDNNERSKCFYEFKKLGIDIFGLPLRGFQKDSNARREFYFEYNSLEAGLRFHILSADGYDDIMSYKDEPVTLDTSLPFLCAQNRMFFPCGRPVPSKQGHGTPVVLDWNRKTTYMELDVMVYNLEKLWYDIHLY